MATRSDLELYLRKTVEASDSYLSRASESDKTEVVDAIADKAGGM